ncbi:MAG: MATE family efflux transporter [Clostridia bacterium]|nr:MATE family efflux transporter [Clostridia bacterium]MCI9085242.1 MATE family efflux transporter [Clostridia bacterium]
MQNNNSLETAPVTKLIFKLAIPTVLAQLVNLLYNIVDRIYVGRIPEIGSLSLAGLGVTFPIILLISAFAMLAGMGGASRAAVSMGAKNNDTAEKILGNSTMLLLIFSVVLSVVFLLTKDWILMRFGASPDTIGYASEYITIYLFGTIFVQLALGLNMFITNQGFTKTSMLTVCIGAVLNIVLDPIFIYVFGMGVKGAALATVISQAVSCLWVLKFLTGKKTILKIKLKNLLPVKEIVFSILSLGVSPFIMQVTECLIQLTFNNGMLKYGNDLYVALMSILFSLTQLIWMPLQGFSQGAQPVIGYNYGAGKLQRVKKAFKVQFIVNLSFSIAAIGMVELFPKFFLGLFTNDAELINIGINTMRLFLVGMAVMGAQSACQQTFLALGEAKISVFLACLRKVILLFPLALILPKVGGMGIWGLLLAEPVSDVIAATCTTTMFYFRSKKLLSVSK